ncbi:MAG: hypothetical protein ACXVAF_03970 [Vulcanimicrobiaceae bacterium]
MPVDDGIAVKTFGSLIVGCVKVSGIPLVRATANVGAPGPTMTLLSASIAFTTNDCEVALTAAETIATGIPESVMGMVSLVPATTENAMLCAVESAVPTASSVVSVVV